MEFSYQVKTRTGELLDGAIEAPNETAAVEILQSKGYTILALNKISKELLASDINQIFSKPNTKDIVIFTRQLSTLIDADMPLAEGLRTLAKQVEKPSFRKIISSVSEGVEGGTSLSTALGEFPKLFSPFYVKLVRSGEISGKLHETLDYLAEYLERSQGLNSKIRGALAYPAFVVVAMIIVIVIMAVYVLPQLLGIFKDSPGAELPLTTRMLISFTSFFNNHIFFILSLLIGIPAAIVWYIRTPKGKIWFDEVKLQLPIFNKIIRNLYLARIAETLSTLIKSDIAILDALKVTADLVGNSVYQNVLLSAEESVRGGGTISVAMAESSYVPALMTSMISIGERTGKMEFMLGHVSKFYRTESETDIANISQLIEPILVLVLGLGVAILVASILLPIYSLVGTT